MALYELTLRGFKGDTDKTDHLILWVETEMSESQVKQYLTTAGLLGPGRLIEEIISLWETSPMDRADFLLPAQFDEFKSRVEQLTRREPVIEMLFAAADAHGEDTGEPDHAVGDLQDLLRLAWGIMTLDQQLQFLALPETQSIIEAGSRDEFTAESLSIELRQMATEQSDEPAYRLIERFSDTDLQKLQAKWQVVFRKDGEDFCREPMSGDMSAEEIKDWASRQCEMRNFTEAVIERW